MTPDVVVVGAGIVGAACAYHLSRAGLRVTVLERGAVAGGTSGSGEGNLLVSDKEPGPELALAMRSNALWLALGEEVGGFELEPKGGVMVASSAAAMSGLASLALNQGAYGVTARLLSEPDLRELEPHLAPGFAGGAFYPQDMQVQPMLATANLLVRSGATVHCGVEVTGLRRAGGRVTAVETASGDAISTPVVVNAAGTWAGSVFASAGVRLPIAPRRGFILVTEPLPPLIRHKVQDTEYLANVASDDAGLQASAVVEGTAAGTILIGSTRERVGFDRTFSLPALRLLAANALRLFPALAGVSAMRAYRGFRPYSPDHLPVIGADPQVAGLWHACGHEGAGIGLAPATGELITALVTGAQPAVDPAPFAPARFAAPPPDGN
ncbi:FAD-dependent oxidoreductase [Luedemannella helvata]|uniref:FAD-dependent oxidoreductase n=1 Tax=Luedemannella helvata TaxID=349315 RepID=A0ABP4WJT3_9ACTN